MYVMTFVRVTTFSALACPQAPAAVRLPGPGPGGRPRGRCLAWRPWKEDLEMELERDDILAHGSGQFLNERLMETFDISKVYVCDLRSMFATHILTVAAIFYIYIIYNLNICKGCNNIHKALRSLPQNTQEWRFLVLHFVAVNLHMSYCKGTT